jgi:Flp pilus assembly pilin Flp
MQFIKRFIVEDEGAEVVEWALLVVVIGLAVVAGGPTLTSNLQTALGNIGGKTASSSAAMNGTAPAAGQ